MAFDLSEALSDGGYPGSGGRTDQSFQFFAPLTPLAEPDLERFWLLEYRWPNGITPLGLVFAGDALQWAGQYAAWRAPLPPANGIDYRLVGTHLYSAELPQSSVFECNDRAARLARRLPAFVHEFRQRWDTAATELLEGVTTLERADLDMCDLRALGRYLADARSYNRRAWEVHFEFTYLLLMLYAAFGDLCDQLGLPAGVAKRLLQGYPSRVTEADQALWDFVEAVRARPDAAARLLAAPPADGRVALAGAPALLDAADRLLAALGWRTETVGDPLARPWVENESAFWATVQSSLRHGDAGYDVAAAVARAAAERETAIEEARAGLTRAERDVFDRALADCTTANFVWWSEDHNILIDMRSFIPVRRAALAIGARLGLAEPEDTVFCFYDELERLCEGTLNWRDLARLVADRRAYYEGWRRRRPEMPKFLGVAPEVISDPIMVEIDGVTPDFLAAARGGREPTALRGLVAAPGKATGRARVLHAAEDIALLGKNDILVCEGTTSSWTPAFTRIAGCVCDQGGSLSHAAIISREYGVPCVVGTATATAAIREGDTVEVDGFTGTVRVLVRAAQDAA